MLRGLRVVGVGMAAVLLVVMGAEQWTVPTPSAPVPPPPYFFPEGSVPPAYNWLADQRDNGVVIEFPIQLGVATRGYPIMYYQKIHRHPLINGLSSYQPSLYWDIMSQLDVAQTPISGLKFTPAQIGMLQTLEVRYLLFNQRAYKTRHWEQIEESLALYPQVKFIGQYDIHRIYTLEPLEEGAQPRFGWRAPVTVEMGASMPITVTIVNPYAYQLLTRLEPDLDVIVDWQRKEDGTQASSQNASSGDGEPGRWQPPGALFPIQSIHYSSLLNNPATVRAELTLETEMLVYQGAHLYKTSVSAPSQAGKYLLRLFPKWRLPLYKVAPPTEVLVTTRP
jgi:hypothetical protein